MTHPPITPPPELVQEWLGNYFGCILSGEPSPADAFLATQSACWGADQELEACCEWVSQWCPRWPDGTRPEDELRAARRPPSLKEQALAQTDAILNDPSRVLLTEVRETLELNRRALEQLND